VTGSSWNDVSHEDCVTIAYDAATGSRVWATRYDGDAGEAEDLASALGVSPDASKVFIAGTTDAPDQEYLIIAYAAG
jgi:hypothetical protein